MTSVLPTRKTDDSDGSDTSSSSSELTDDSDCSTTSQNSNTAAIALLYANAVPRTRSAASKTAGLSKRSSERLAIALIAARLALLRKKWTDLLAAFKKLETALKSVADGATLGWRLPVLARLTGDAIVALNAAANSKRSLPSSEAKALTTMRRKLPRSPNDTMWHAAVTNIAKSANPFDMFELSQSDTSVIDCLELTLLAENRTICLSHLKLATVPPILEKLPDLLAWYSLFEKLDASISDFTVLELSNNSITYLPAWIPYKMPALTILEVSDNPLTVLPSTLPLFAKIEHLGISAKGGTTNVLSLVEKASSLLGDVPSNAEMGIPAVPPLTTLCWRILRESEPKNIELLPPHLQKNPDEGSYTCAGCKKFMVAKHKQWLSAPLAERLFLFNPPLTSTDEDQQINKTSYVIGGAEWRFCAPCLYVHCREGECGCIVCEEEQRVVREEKGIRWARRRI